MHPRGNDDFQGLELKRSFVFRGRESSAKNIPWPSSAKKKDEFCEMFYSHLGCGAADHRHREVLMEYRQCTGHCVVQQEIFYQIQHASAKGEYCKHDPVWALCISRTWVWNQCAPYFDISHFSVVRLFFQMRKTIFGLWLPLFLLLPISLYHNQLGPLAASHIRILQIPPTQVISLLMQVTFPQLFFVSVPAYTRCATMHIPRKSHQMQLERPFECIKSK